MRQGSSHQWRVFVCVFKLLFNLIPWLLFANMEFKDGFQRNTFLIGRVWASYWWVLCFGLVSRAVLGAGSQRAIKQIATGSKSQLPPATKGRALRQRWFWCSAWSCHRSSGCLFCYEKLEICSDPRSVSQMDAGGDLALGASLESCCRKGLAFPASPTRTAGVKTAAGLTSVIANNMAAWLTDQSEDRKRVSSAVSGISVIVQIKYGFCPISWVGWEWNETTQDAIFSIFY